MSCHVVVAVRESETANCPRQSSMQQKAWLILPVVICLSHWLKKEFEVRFLPGPPNSRTAARPTDKKMAPQKKEWQVGQDNNKGGWSRRAELAARTGAYALLSRADGQLTQAGQHYYSHLGLRPPSKDFHFNQPLIRKGPNDYILLRNGRKKSTG